MLWGPLFAPGWDTPHLSRFLTLTLLNKQRPQPFSDTSPPNQPVLHFSGIPRQPKLPTLYSGSLRDLCPCNCLSNFKQQQITSITTQLQMLHLEQISHIFRENQSPIVTYNVENTWKSSFLMVRDIQGCFHNMILHVSSLSTACVCVCVAKLCLFLVFCGPVCNTQ